MKTTMASRNERVPEIMKDFQTNISEACEALKAFTIACKGLRDAKLNNVSVK